jgi:hypothetical protein
VLRIRPPRAIPICFIGLLPLRSAGGQSPYSVGPNVHVSRSQASVAYQETQIAADPRRAAHLIACAIAMPGDSFENVFYLSSDGGKTWSPTHTVRPGVDPSCAINRHGVAFAGSVHDSALAGGSAFLRVQWSPDGGRTWQESSVRVNTRSMDRSYVTVEDGPGPIRNRVYIHAYISAPRDDSGKRVARYAVLYTSLDGGRTFDLAAPIPAVDFSEPTFFPANGIITADGSFVGLVVELDNSRKNMFLGRSDSASAPHASNGVLRLIRSTDGGNTVDLLRVSEVFYDWRVPQLSMASLAADRTTGPYRGRLYAAWPDARAEWRTQILFASSDDQGRTWSPPRIVSDDAGALKPGDRPNHLMPMVTVNNKGIIGLSWYDRRESPNNLSYRPRFAASLSGGASWLPSVPVSTSPNELTQTDKHLNGGDTAGLTADANGVFHLLWIDNRTGVHQVWTTTVKVRGKVGRPHK